MKIRDIQVYLLGVILTKLNPVSIMNKCAMLRLM